MGMSTDGMAITPYLNSWAQQQGAPKKTNGYVAFWKGKKTELRADTTYEAQQLAAGYFRCKRSHEITIVLAEKGGDTIHHTPS